MSQRNPARPRSHPPNTATSSPLLSSSTITFLASWRGQLLTCSVVLILGGIYFVLQEPIANLRRRRRETLSRVRGEELLSMQKPAEKEMEDTPKEKRGREKKKDAKKRKGSLLKAPTGALGGSSSATVSSIENSPAPIRTPLPAKPTEDPSVCGRTAQASSPVTPARARSTSQQKPPSTSLALAASPILADRKTSISHATPSSPYNIPLPASPLPGSSRLAAAEPDSESLDGDGDSTSDSATSNNIVEDKTATHPVLATKSPGFSIIPEEGYLPISTPAQSAKKKKNRKGKTAPSQLPLVESLKRRPSVDTANGLTHSGLASPTVPVTPSRHARKASLNRPLNADLDELLTERERTIESLRAEIGIAKAEEWKAKEEIGRGRSTEERLKGDLERLRKANQRSDNEGRKREGELTARLNQLSNHYTVALHRINALENMFRESGIAVMPSSPAVVPQGHSLAPAPMHHLQPMPSPGMPGSPFGLPFGTSPRAVSAGFVPYPSPGIYPSQYPSPMLHPHYHISQSPSPFRRASTGGPSEEPNGPFTPGHVTQNAAGPSSGQYPFDLGIMPPPSSGPRPSNPGAPPSAADLRRQSIESSVLKKKVKPEDKNGSDSGEESTRSNEPLPGIVETEIHGLGRGDVGDPIDTAHIENGDRAEASSTGSQDSLSHPSSPSPPTRASMLLTPASAHIFQRALVNGADTPDEFSISNDPGMDGIKVIHDGDRGNVYYVETDSRRGSEMSNSDSASAYEPESLLNGHVSSNGHVDTRTTTDNEAANGKDDAQKEDYVPMFASLAHTPQQIAEIQRMREEAMKARGKGVKA